jgi:hypothetical protein
LVKDAAEPGARPKSITKGYFEAMLRSGPELADVATAKILLESEDPEIRDLAAEYYPKLWKAYKSKTADIRTFFFGQHTPWGIVLCWDGHFDYDYRVEIAGMVPAAWERQLQECATAINNVQGIFRQNQKQVILGQLITLVQMLFTAVDAVVSNPESQAVRGRLDESVTFVEERRSEIDKSIRSLALQKDQRSAQQAYLFGMLPGLALIGALLVPIMIYTGIGRAVEITLGAGALGAILSVLTRVTRAQTESSLDIDYQVGKALIFFAGFFRPIVGALLAGALYVLINAGLVPLRIPGQPETEFFFAAIAFLAGFSERLAQDTLVSTSRATF